MARLARAIFPDHPHHVTQRGNGRAQTFSATTIVAMPAMSTPDWGAPVISGRAASRALQWKVHLGAAVRYIAESGAREAGRPRGGLALIQRSCASGLARDGVTMTGPTDARFADFAAILPLAKTMQCPIACAAPKRLAGRSPTPAKRRRKPRISALSP